MVYPDNEILFSDKKNISYQASKRHRRILNTHCYVKEANSNRLHTLTITTMILEIWKRQNYGDSKKGQYLPGLRPGGERKR